MSNVRIAYSRETPSSWKGSLALLESMFPSAVTLQNSTFFQIMSATDLELRERRLIINVQPSVSPAIPSAQPVYVGPIVGSYFLIQPAVNYGSLGRRFNAGLRITCNGYTQSVLQCDSRQGVYRLPPCTSVQVSAVLSRVTEAPNAGTYDSPVTIRAELSDSCDGPVTRPTETTFVELAAAATCFLNLNPYCRWIDFGATAFNFGVANSPILQATPANTGPGIPFCFGPTIERDYVNKTWFPSGDPVDIGGGQSTVANAGAGAYLFKNAGTDTAYAQFTQFLEW